MKNRIRRKASVRAGHVAKVNSHAIGEISKCRQTLRMHEELVKMQRISIDLLEQVVNDTIRILGPEFIALNPKQMRALDDGRGNFLKPERVDISTYAGQQMTIRNINMHALLAWVDRSDRKAEFRRQVHVMADLGEGKVCYALSDEALASTPDDILIRNISHSLARTLVEGLRKGGAA